MSFDSFHFAVWQCPLDEWSKWRSKNIKTIRNDIVNRVGQSEAINTRWAWIEHTCMTIKKKKKRQMINVGFVYKWIINRTPSIPTTPTDNIYDVVFFDYTPIYMTWDHISFATNDKMLKEQKKIRLVLDEKKVSIYLIGSVFSFKNAIYPCTIRLIEANRVYL